LEHVWSYVDAAGELIHAEASWHGGHGPLVPARRLSPEGGPPVAYAQPGKHAMAAHPGGVSKVDGPPGALARRGGPRARRRRGGRGGAGGGGVARRRVSAGAGRAPPGGGPRARPPPGAPATSSRPSASTGAGTRWRRPG